MWKLYLRNETVTNRNTFYLQLLDQTSLKSQIWMCEGGRALIPMFRSLIVLHDDRGNISKEMNEYVYQFLGNHWKRVLGARIGAYFMVPGPGSHSGGCLSRSIVLRQIAMGLPCCQLNLKRIGAKFAFPRSRLLLWRPKRIDNPCREWVLREVSCSYSGGRP